VKLGFHMPVSKGFEAVSRDAKRLSCEVIQIFVKNPRSWERNVWGDNALEAFRALSGELPVFAHLSYLPNLARIDEDRRNMEGFKHEVELTLQLGIRSLTVHCGSRANRDLGIAMTASALNRALKEYDVSLLLENASGQGNAIGRDLDELQLIFEKVERKEKVFLCLDTAHLFEAGYDVRKKRTWRDIITKVERCFGKDKIALFHLNDSKTPLASRVDRHWHIGRGEIGTSAFKILLNEKRFAHLYGIMETPKMGMMDEENMKTMRSLLSPLMSRSSS
jgi:deoxyribonuclease IV